MKTDKIRSFTDLKAWQKGHKFVLKIYRITRVFPQEEVFGLISQLRRAVVSITSNIAEGFGRRSVKDKIRFYELGLSSLREVQNQLIISRDLKYIDNETFSQLAEDSVELSKLISSLIKGAPNL